MATRVPALIQLSDPRVAAQLVYNNNNRRYETPTKSASRKLTKSAVTIGILLPSVPLHYRCLPYTSVIPFLALTLQRSAFIRNTDRPKLGFFEIFQKWDKSKCHQNYANEPCFPHLLTYGSSKHQHITCSRRGAQSHTIHMSFTTVDVYVSA